jgi:glycosyltransferase involved in cell wall biosynthesis
MTRLRALIRSEAIDIVHAHLFDGAVYASLAARSLGVPCVVTLHGQVDIDTSTWKGRIKSKLLASAAYHVVAVSHALASEVRNTLSLGDSQLRVIHNGVSGRHMTPAPHRSKLHRVVAVGNIRAPKNYPGLLAAIALVREVLPDVHLDILGEPDRGTLFLELQEQLHELGLENAVTFHGFVADPSLFLSQASAFVLASTKEGFSLAIVEAMLAGTPVVSTRSGGPEEIVSHDETGLLVSPGDSAALAGALVRVLTEPSLSDRLANQAQAHALRAFSLEGMVTAYEQLYRKVITI